MSIYLEFDLVNIDGSTIPHGQSWQVGCKLHEPHSRRASKHSAVHTGVQPDRARNERRRRFDIVLRVHHALCRLHERAVVCPRRAAGVEHSAAPKATEVAAGEEADLVACSGVWKSLCNAMPHAIHIRDWSVSNVTSCTLRALLWSGVYLRCRRGSRRGQSALGSDGGRS